MNKESSAGKWVKEYRPNVYVGVAGTILTYSALMGWYGRGEPDFFLFKAGIFLLIALLVGIAGALEAEKEVEVWVKR